MKELVFMRHGAALSIRETGTGKDENRKLSPEGRKQIAASAGRLKELGFTPDVIISSPFLRAVQTADIAAALFPAARRLKEPALVSYDVLPEILEAISADAKGAHFVLVTGHQPTLGALSGILLNTPCQPFHTGSFAYFKVHGGPELRGAELVEFFTPEPI